jgi:hypothetical protein
MRHRSLFLAGRLVAELTSLSEAVAELVHDGDSVALEGLTHLIPFAAGMSCRARGGGSSS